MKLGIMQPYFLPYIGYFQLIGAVDRFVLYDNIKYTKKGWINRNRFLRGGRDEVLTIPLQAGSDALQICDREVAPDFDRAKLLNRLAAAYRKAPQFDPAFALIERVVNFPERNLFAFLEHSIRRVCDYLGIATPLVPSSSLGIDHSLPGERRVLALCEHEKAGTYVNAIGGRGLYARETFAERGIDLRFLSPLRMEYAQFGAPFVPWLSIADVAMFNAPARLRELLVDGYELV
jgi:hypothetical protein